MNQHTQLVSNTAPAAPTAVIQKLSFCKTTARDLAAWLLTLPKANTGEYSRQLYMALSELSNLQATPELRLQLLEQLRPEVALITKQLEKNHLLGSVILSARATKVANLCQTLQHLLNSGYKQAAADLQNKKSTALVLAIQRTLQGLFTTLSRAYLTYRNVPAGLWFEVHQMYRLTAHHGLQQQKVKDPLLNSIDEQTLEQAYCCVLLLGSAPANQMRQTDIKALVDVLPKWAPLAKLQDISAKDSMFAVALTTDTPPRYRALLNLTGRSHILGINPDKLSENIKQALQAREKKTEHPFIDSRLPVQLLQKLQSAWGDIAKRTHERTPTTGTLEICLGMSSVHYHLADGTAFEKTLNQPQPKTTLELIPEEPGPEANDIWANAVDAFQESASKGDMIDYVPPGEEEEEEADTQDYASMYPVLTASIVNRSSRGYCLEWKTGAPANLQTGDILALRHSSSTPWAIGLTRWIRQNNQSGAQIGIEQLSHTGQPCGTQLLRSGKAASSYLRALLVPEVEAFAFPPQVITATVPFREGNTVMLNIKGIEERAILGKLVQQTACCSLFEYEIMKKAPPPDHTLPSSSGKPATEAGVHAKVNDPDDFSSLWDIL